MQHIISEIEKTDPEIYERLDSRRDVMKRFTNVGGKIALTALPFAIGSMFNKAYGQTSTSIVDILNFALTLEYLEAGYYTTAVSTSGLIDAAELPSFTHIRDNENAHVSFLSTTITALGGTPAALPTFDFTAGGTYADVFSNVDTFYAVAQTFEDTGVRAYKGQAAGLMSNNDVLTAALQIHSVEARHASHVRKLRGVRAAMATIQPWITGKDTAGIGAGVQATYDGEENTTQLGLEIKNINGQSISADAATEAFDEPLTMDQVLAIVDPFIV